MIDISSIFKVFKGNTAENFRVLTEGYVKLFEQMDKRVDKLEKELKEQRDQNNELSKLLQNVVNMEERCLDQNVKNNEVIRNLAEWIIFTERRPEITVSIGKLLKK